MSRLFGGGTSERVPQVSKPAVSPTSQSARDSLARRLGNLRYSRLGNLRYSRLGSLRYLAENFRTSQAVVRVMMAPIKVYQGQKTSVPITFIQRSRVRSHFGSS